MQTYYLQDAPGSTMGLTDGSGSVTDSYTYDVFGATKSHVGTSANQYRFPGGLQDVQVARGLCYIGVRRDTMSGWWGTIGGTRPWSICLSRRGCKTSARGSLLCALNHA